MSATCLLLPTSAFAEHTRAVPAGLTGTVTSASFVVHFDPATIPGEPGMTIAQYAQAASADLEEAYSRLVTGAGGVPNAGLAAPVPDSDAKTDLYIAFTTIPGTGSGGYAINDTHLADSTKLTHYMTNSPDQARGPFRFRDGHEFMHVVQAAYKTPFGPTGPWGPGSGFDEGFANWAAEYALPDIDPLDTNFGPPQSAATPSVPLDCVSGSWDGTSCGGGYWQWLFMQAQVEDYGGDFATGFYNRFRTDFTRPLLNLLDDEIKSQTGNASDVRQRFAQYARDVWEPARWTTGSVAKLHLASPPVSAPVSRATLDTGTIPVSVDHMSTRYVRIYNDGGFQPTGPNDEILISVGRPGGLATTSDYLELVAGNPWTDNTGPGGGPGTGMIGANGDPALVREIVLPLTNDTLTTDDLGFSYRVQYLPGAPTPPANDLKPGALPALLNQDATSDNVYAGGQGSIEAPNCPLYDVENATRGVWFRFTAGSGPGTYTYDARTSGFPAVVALYEAGSGAFAGCSSSGRFAGQQEGGETFDVYVGRRADVLGTDSDVRLRVSAVPFPVAEAPIVAPPPVQTGGTRKKCKKKRGKKKKCKKKAARSGRSSAGSGSSPFSLAGSRDLLYAD